MRSFLPTAFTLIELLIALALSLLLLLAVTQLLGRVGGSMNDARTAMGTSAQIHEAAMLLRQDLAQIPPNLAKKPADIEAGNSVDDHDGYLEIVEGPNTALNHPYKIDGVKQDFTVGDVDDIIAFTVVARSRGLLPSDQSSFRGLITDDEGELRVEERDAAEIAWFVRGNTLYRRMRLIDDQRAGEYDMNTLVKLAQERNRRFGLDGFNPEYGPSSNFPYPRYAEPPSGWYYLRMPLLEETIQDNWDPKVIGSDWAASNPHPDLWESPHFFPEGQDRLSGALDEFVTSPRNPRAGEDVVLTNVLSFDIKVWCPDAEKFVDLGESGTIWETSKQPFLPRTWDSWAVEGECAGEDPPFVEPLEAIQITIRCFDPASRVIKQVTVVHRFEN